MSRRRRDRPRPPGPEPEPRTEPKLRARRLSRPLRIGAAALALAVIGAVVWWAGRGDSPPEGPRVILPPPHPETASPDSIRAADFVGAETCGQCHQDQYREWEASTHGRAGGAPTPERVLAAFDGTPIRFRDAVVVPESSGGEFRFRVRWDGLPEQVVRVDGVIGGGHMVGGGTQGFVTRAPDGTLRFLPFDFARQQGVWFCNTGTRKGEGWVPITAELSLADCGDWPPVRVLGDTPRFATCQGCHGSQIELTYDTAQARFRTGFATLAINCESCHGPGREHVELARSGDVARAVDIGMRPLETLGEEASLDLCFQCHAVKDRLEPGYLPGESLEDHYSLKFPMLGESPFLPDGRVRTFAYQQNHRFSDCYLNGTFTCVDCHDPHSQGYRDHTGTALESRFSNGQCTSCHASKGERLVEHTRHPAQSPGSQCVSCHMPYLQHPEVGPAVRFSRSDHTIPVPRPGWDESLGIENACSKCHEDRTVEELDRQVAAWWGDLKPRKDLVLGLARARELSDPAEVGELVLRPEDDFPMAQFAGLAHFLESALEPEMAELDPEVERRLMRLAASEDVDIRALALASLHYARGEDAEVRGFLAERLRGLGGEDRRVRQRWATALGFLADRLQQAGRAGDGAAVYAKALEILPDDPRLLLNYGLALAAAGDLAGAVGAYRRVLEREPGQSLAWINLGVALERQGDPESASRAYQEAIRRDPHNALPYFNLGNQHLRQGRPDLAVPYYRQAASIDPSLAQVHFYLARAYIFLGEYDRALGAVRYGLKFQPQDATGRRMLLDLERAVATADS